MNSNTQALVPLQDLFNPRESSDGKTEAPKRILIRGRAGIGKTTLSKKIVYEYTRHRMWREQFSLLLWVPLRKLKRKRFVSLTDFFREEYFRQKLQGRAIAETLSEHIQGPDKAKTLFVLDGWDEIQGWEVDESVETLRSLLNHPTVIITSRPAGVNLSSIDPMDLELETIGFSQENVSAYLEHEEVVSSEGMATDIKQFIQSNPFVQEVVNVPIQLDAFCYSWDEIKQMRQADHTFTVTTLYQAMIHKLWRKDILRLEKQDHGIPLTAEVVNALRNSKRLTRAVQSESDFLSALAFDRFQENQIEFTNREIDHVIEKLEAKGMQLPLTLESNLTKLSFLHADDHDAARDKRSYHFMHLTFQEFFAAQWLVKLLTSDPSQVEDCVRWHKYDPRYEIVWRFMAGLLPDDAALNSFFDWLDQGPQDLLGIQHQHLIMHCLNESKGRLNNPERQQTLELNLCEWVEFEIETMGGSTLGVSVAFPEAQLLQWLKGKPRRADIIAVLAKRPVLSEEAIECLTALLKDTDNSVRSGAAEALGKQSNLLPEAIEGLMTLLRDTDDSVGSWAAVALSRQSNLPPEAIEGLIALLKGTDNSVGSWAAEALSRQSNLPPGAIGDLIALLKDKDNSVRFRAAEALGKQSNLPPEATEGLMTLLTDTDNSARSSAAEALGKQSNLPPKAIEGLVTLLKDTDDYVRSNAADVLGRQSNLPPKAIEDLVALLKDTNSFVRSGAVKALGSQSNLPHEAVEGLIAWLTDTDKYMRFWAAAVLGRQSNLPPKAIEGLVTLLKDTDDPVQSRAAEALGRQSNLPPETIEDLMALLKGTNRFVQSGALQVFYWQSNLPPEAIEGLIALLTDTGSFARWEAAKVLGRQSNLPPEAIEGLIALLTDTERFVRSEAAKVLGGQSNLPPEAIEGLIALLTDTYLAVQSTAAEALGRQSNLPTKAIEGLIALLKDTEKDLQFSAARALDRQRMGQLYHRLETLEHSSMECLYSQYLVKWSVARITPLYLEGGTLYFYTSSKLESVSLREEAAFRQTLLEVQKRTGIPSASWVKTSKWWRQW
jgi:HEAT repeat protein